MAGMIEIDFSEVEERKNDKSDFDMDAEMEKIDAVFAETCALFSDELWDGCMSRGMKRIVKGSQRLSFQKFRTPGINSKVIHYLDSENNFGVIFSKSIMNGDEGFGVMQAFRVPKSPGQPADIIYPFGVDKPKESDVAFLKKMCEDGMCRNFR